MAAGYLHTTTVTALLQAGADPEQEDAAGRRCGRLYVYVELLLSWSLLYWAALKGCRRGPARSRRARRGAGGLSL